MERETKFVVEIQPGVYYEASRCYASSTSYLDLACSYDSEAEAKEIAKHYPDSKVRKIEITHRLKEPDWIVISYKESHSDYCRGCYMGTYSSKFHMRRFNDEENAIQYIASLDRSLEQLDAEYVHLVLNQDEIFGEERPDEDEGWFYPMFSVDSQYSEISTDSHFPAGWNEKIKAKKVEMEQAELKKERDKEMPLFKNIS